MAVFTGTPRTGTVDSVTDEASDTEPTSGNAPDIIEEAAGEDGPATRSTVDRPAKPNRTLAGSRDDKLPVKMLNDRILVSLEADGERKSTGGILIPATAQMGKRLAWGEVVAVGPNVRSMEPGDQVLFNPEDRYEVDVRGKDYLILRERDIHAVAAERLEEGSTGLYL